MFVNNTSPYAAADYDSNIERTIPYYSFFYQQTLDLVAAIGQDRFQWLDCGCGTGTMAEMALERFPDAEFTLCDPSAEMVGLAKQKLSGEKRILAYRVLGTENLHDENRFDVATAIQSHHYFREDERVKATQNVYRALKEGGMYIFFENTAPATQKGKEIVMKRWAQYQREHGKTEAEIETYLSRYGKNYFPIPLAAHLHNLKQCGFKTVEPFWLSVMQAGFYAIR